MKEMPSLLEERKPLPCFCNTHLSDKNEQKDTIPSERMREEKKVPEGKSCERGFDEVQVNSEGTPLLAWILQRK